MNKLIMVDIETTGIDPKKEDLLQVGLLQMSFVDGYWVGGTRLSIQVHSDRQPTTVFAKEHMVDLYKLSNEAPYISAKEIREQIIEFAKSFDMRPPNIKFAGWNAGIFDVPFLVEKGILEPSVYEQRDGKEIRVGDFHYRIYDITGALEFVKNIYQTESLDDIKAKFDVLTDRRHAALPEGKKHDALYDCVNQMNTLNDLLGLMRK